MNAICKYYGTLIISLLCIDYIQLPYGQLQMVPMPLPQYDYPYGYPMAVPLLTSPGVGHLQMSVFRESSAGPVTYG